ncbi:MAG: penicillin acylase family protein [Shinella sp.]|nr:penicillin acylase family protein [Shinella sp.]
MTRLDKATLPGLRDKVSIAIDEWGIAHISATNKHDLFFAQGYNAARDRLWQIDLWRKRGLGLLSADFGPGYLEQDRAARLFLYRGDMAREWAAYGSDAEDIAAAFVEGINAYIDGLDGNPDALPPEFKLFGTFPSRWQAADVVRIRSHSLMRNALSEVIRANVVSAAGVGVDLLRQNLDPPKDPVIPEGVKLDEIPLEVLDTFKLALAAVTFEDERLKAEPAQAGLWRKVAATGDVVRDAAAQGSNNWVIHPDRTATRRPILANDPHRTHAVPSLRYIVHLTCPEFDVIGAGEPCLPGICIGHNGSSAFGLTLFFGHDQEDVYVYDISPDDPTLYRYGGGWERMTLIEEEAEINGYGAATHVLRFTRHGPIVYEDRERNRAYAIRSVWFDPGTAPYFASIASMRARSFQEFRRTMARWGVPATNQVYADTSGTIGWVAAGFSPIRPNWDGLLPVAGDGRYEWQGYFPAEELPHSVNPEKGFIATANEQNLPIDWPHEKKQIGYEWLERSRANRIAEVLSADGAGTVASSGALQADVLSLPAHRLTKIVADLAVSVPHENIASAETLFQGWDHRLSVDSGAAALFEVWWSKHLRPALLRMVTNNPSIQALLLPGDPESVLALLESPDGRLGNDPFAARDALFIESLGAAFAECRARMGEDHSLWRWGTLHRAYFEHATSRLRPAEERASADVGPLEKPGSDSTPMNAFYRNSDFQVSLGASVRIVVDVGAWDNSICINAPGQSGDPRSPHYGDLAEAWAKGDFVPMLYSKESVEAATEQRMELLPAPQA